jgi:hypothetical protein
MSTISGVKEAAKDVLDKWYEATNRKQITLVTAGRSGVGKSTLIGNMLQLKGDAAPQYQHGPSSTTTEVKTYTNTVNGVEVKIIDTPGLAATDVNEAKIIAQLQAESRGEADMLLYCVSLLPDSKIDEQDAKVIKTLKVAFGPDIWSHAILVLTFANWVILDLEEGTTLNDLVRAYAAKFESILQSECPSLSVCSIFSCDHEEVKRDSSTMIALPAGRNPKQQLVEGMKWDESIYTEVLKKCNPDAIPALLKVREPTPEIAILAIKIGLYFKAGGQMIVGGAQIMAAKMGYVSTTPSAAASGTVHTLQKMVESFNKFVSEETRLKKLRGDMQKQIEND